MLSPFEWMIAKRYLWPGKGEAFIALVAGISVGVVMLSVYPESQFALRAIRSGAAAYLNKGCSPDTLLAALHRAAQGGSFITPEIAELMT